MAMVMDTATRTDTADGRPWLGDDFPDGLSPMLVRELRQGIQSGAFVWTFLLLQAALVVHAAFSVFATTGPFGGSAIRASGGLFWTILVLGVGVVLPLRGLTAISSERAGNNLDLVRLTRLSATRIVVGKWGAIVAQVLLATTAALPYLVLRYFLGGIDVLEELERLGWLVLVAAVVAAVAVYASTRPLRERIGLVLLAAFGGWSLLMANVAVSGRSRSVGRGSAMAGFAGPGDWFWLGVAAVYVTLLLEAAASSIAPPSENHALRKRAIGLACAAAIAGAGLASPRLLFASIAFACGLPLIVLAAGAICERPVRFRRMHAAFDCWGVVGRVAAAVLTPGWATGLVFVAIAGGLTVAGFLAQFPGDRLTAAPICLAAAAILFPLPLLLLVPRLEHRMTLYVAVQAVSLVVFGMAVVLGEISGSHSAVAVPLVLPFPLAGLLLLASREGSAIAAPLATAGVAMLGIVLCLVARPWLREMRETQRLVCGEPPT